MSTSLEELESVQCGRLDHRSDEDEIRSHSNGGAIEGDILPQPPLVGRAPAQNTGNANDTTGHLAQKDRMLCVPLSPSSSGRPSRPDGGTSRGHGPGFFGRTQSVRVYSDRIRKRNFRR